MTDRDEASIDPGTITTMWVHRLADRRLLMGLREGVKAQLSAWLTHLDAAAAGDEPAGHELFKLAAFHARALGFDGRPASAAIGQIIELRAAVAEACGHLPSRLERQIDELLRVVADAHALGHAERLGGQHAQVLRNGAPVIRLDDTTIAAFVIGPMHAENVDALVGRLLREVAATGAQQAVVDLFGADDPDDRFHETAALLLQSPEGRNVHLVLTGARDPEKTQDAILGHGVDAARVEVAASFNAWLAARRI